MIEWLEGLDNYDIFALGISIVHFILIGIFWGILTYLNTLVCYTDRQLAVGNRVENLLQLTYVNFMITLMFIFVGYLLPYYSSGYRYY